ncbi:MAG: hypothetical protein IJH39_08010, partial [Clostridia bacterium]|nr:hypothetical protein [Clostridia bacterium]
MDAVITYVDITERFKKDYNIYCKKNLQLNRFRSYGVLDLQIKLIRKYMPYIKNIFVIVSHEEQVEGIDLSDAKVITHDQIIPSAYIPCFNSCTIEMFIWKIPGLSEEFVYFNDDTFVIDNVHHTKWFVKGKPCLNPNIHDVNKYETNVYKKNCEKSTEVITSLLNTDKYKGKYITQAHIARPFLKSTCETVFNKTIIHIQRSLTRTRHSKNLNATLFNDYDYISGNYYNIENNYAYLRTYENDEIERNIIGKEYPLICINDNDTFIDFNDFKSELRKNLQDNLNGKVYDKPIKEKTKILKITDKLIVSFTSWPKRIQYCKHTIDLMMNQTIVPDKIILNLSEDEFPNKKYDLPIELVNEEIDNDKFEIYWVKENTTVWKKIIPTMDRFPNDLVFSIDDDIEYPSNYIEEMYKTYCENNKLYPVVGYEFMIDNNLCHSGPFTLTSKKFYGDLLNNIYNDLILPTIPNKKWQSDIVYYKVLNTLGYKYIKCNKINGNSLYSDSDLNKENRYSIWNKLFKDSRKENVKLIDEYLKNQIKYTDKKLIVSLTSYPARIKYVKDVLESLINQSVSFSLYHIVLVLAIPEFPNKEDDLPNDLVEYINKYSNEIEILWYERNIRSHKKLIPTLKQYPNNPILVCDDDIYRPNGWIRMFLEDHEKYPNDIIFGTSSWYFGNDYKLKRFKQFKCEKSGSINNLPEQIFKTAKPANGLGGCLYPANTFTDKRFFDENLFMKLSPTSDESWQYCFNIMDNKTFRQTSKIIDYSKYFLDGTQEIPSSLHKINNYTEINDKLFKEFPKFKTMLNKRMKEFIVAFTTHGVRVKYINKTLNSLLNQTLKPYKIVITIHKDDEQYITKETYDLIKKYK